jgi:hypothetical protein
LEKQVAKFLGGVRIVRTNYGESIEDVQHPYFAIECKYGGQVPAWCNVLRPTSNGEFDLIPLKYGMWSWDIKTFHIVCQKRDEFLRKGIAQALAYNPDKTPVLCLKPKGYKGMVIVMRHSDYMRGVNPRFGLQEKIPAQNRHTQGT